jgi:murein L,D-transpeptidase YafK
MRASRRQLTLFAVTLGLATACTQAPEAPRLPPPPAPAAPLPELPCERIVRVEILKGARVLRAYCERGAVVEMVAALGREPDGHKLASGDRRTPEGSYQVVEPARDSQFHLFIPIDYPSRSDADAALAERRISLGDYRRIIQALEAGEIPPADTPLGGAIGIHGEGRRWKGDSEDMDWTMGCVAVTAAEIEFLGARLEAGTPVEILP